MTKKHLVSLMMSMGFILVALHNLGEKLNFGLSMPKYYWVMSFSLSYVYDYQGYKVRQVVTFMSLLFIGFQSIIKIIALHRKLKHFKEKSMFKNSKPYLLATILIGMGLANLFRSLDAVHHTINLLGLTLLLYSLLF